ncbi:hypothetical protein QDX21_07095 [Auritidibacter ignavus]|uniref:Uncharacterized protein n=1 Tax=Auritidibacter ignavus TaxID=678932 RepID=A0AAJ6DBI3_9MICC|nr:hypothetical protein [Auritidibacter ignavus]WGH92101.1 hypothetical protein QDX21_07095 [Auritidibacter ignavus]
MTGFTGWTSNDAIAELTGTVADLADSAVSRSAQISEAETMSVLSRSGLKPQQSSAVVGESARRGTSSWEVYSRLAGQYRYEVSAGNSEKQALENVLARVEKMMATDILLGSIQQAQFSLAANNVPLYRRVIRPELSKTGVCGLCIAASDRRYTTGDLMPLHAGCKCEVAPILGSADVGYDMNQEDLNVLYDVAGGSSNSMLKKVRVREVEHTELGLVLTDVTHGVKDLHESRKTASVLDGQIDDVKKSLRINESIRDKLLKEEANGVDNSKPLYWTNRAIKAHKTTLDELIQQKISTT